MPKIIYYFISHKSNLRWQNIVQGGVNECGYHVLLEMKAGDKNLTSEECFPIKHKLYATQGSITYMRERE